MSHKLSGRTRSVSRMWREQYPCPTKREQQMLTDQVSVEDLAKELSISRWKANSEDGKELFRRKAKELLAKFSIMIRQVY